MRLVIDRLSRSVAMPVTDDDAVETAEQLASRLNVSGVEAINLGLAPFVVGDLLKVALAGLALPVSWKLVQKVRR